MVLNLQSFLDGGFSKLGFSVNKVLPLNIIALLTVYTCLTGSKHADPFVKAYAAISVAMGLFFYIFTNEGAKTFGLSQPTAATKVEMKTLGVLTLGQGIIMSALLWGNNIDAITAVGLGWIALAIYPIDGLFVNKYFVGLGVNKALMTFWALFQSIVAAILLLSK